MAGDNHQLIVGLTAGEFGPKPRPAPRIQVSVAVDVGRAVLIGLGHIQHDDFQRYFGYWDEAVAGETGVCDHRQCRGRSG
jgi:hypothetical protein